MPSRLWSDTGPFTIIPEWLLDSPISDGAVRLYGILGRYANDEDAAWPSRGLLAKRMGTTTKSVDRRIAELVKAGALAVEHRLAESLICLVLKQYPGIFRNQFWQQSTPTGDDGNTAAEGFPGSTAGSIGSGHEEYQHVETAQMRRVGVGIDIAGKTNPVAEPGQSRRSASHLILMRATAENLEA